MKGRRMCSTLGMALAGLLGAAVALPALALDPVTEPAAQQQALGQLLQQVPEDTAFFIGGIDDPALSAFNQRLSRHDTQEVRAFSDMIRPRLPEAWPGAALLAWWLDDYADRLEQGTPAPYALREGSALALYADGAMPVMKVMLDDPAAFNATLAKAGEQLGIAPRESEVGDVRVKRWALTQADSPLAIDLALAVQDNALTLALVSQGESDARLQARFTDAERQASLYSASRWETLGNRYAFDDSARGFIDLAHIARSLLAPENTALGRDLARLAPEMINAIDRDLDAACTPDVLGLIEQAPRLVMGNDPLTREAERLRLPSRLIWELSDPALGTQLASLSGSLPTYARHSDDKLLGLAVGLDLANLMPVATTLWSQLTNANVSCPALVELQDELREQNPALLGLASGMAPGVKGIAAALYALELDPASPYGVKGDALLSLSADDPSVLMNLIRAGVPGMEDVIVPANGEPVEVPLPVPGPPVKAALKGAHLVLYSGEQAARQAQALAEEPLNQAGLLAAALDLPRLGERVVTTLDSLSADTDLSALSPDNGSLECSELYARALALADLPVKVDVRSGFSQKGLASTLALSMPAAAPDDRLVPGDYRTESVDAGCRWETLGVERFNPDGSGRYTEQAANGDCQTYRSEFRWQQQGNQLVQTGLRAKQRSSCSAEWESVAPEDYQCTLMGQRDGRFHCLYRFDDNAWLMRYQRQQDAERP